MAETDPLGTVTRAPGTVHLERRLVAPPETVWAAWTDPRRLARWLGPVTSGAPGDGTTFVLRMDDEATATCTVQTWDPPRLLEMAWVYSGEGPSRLRLELRPSEDGGSHLRLDHWLPDDVDPVDYGAGWHVHLESLTATLDGGTAPDFAHRFRRLRPRYQAIAGS